MSFETKELIKISQELFTSDTEAHVRSYINRAYYAVYGHLKSNTPEFANREYVQHKEIFTHFSSIDQGFANIFKTVMDKRVKADYNYSETMTKKSHSFFIKDAEWLIEHFDTEIKKKL
jgi:hypothetical protein